MVQKFIYQKPTPLDFKFQISSRYCFLVPIPAIIVYTQRELLDLNNKRKQKDFK